MPTSASLGTRRDLGRHLAPALVEVVARHHLVEEALVQCGRRVEHSAGRHQRQRPAASHERGQALDATPRRHDPQCHLVERAPHVVGGDADVARDRHLGAAAIGVAVDRGQHRHRQRRHAVEDRAHGRGHGGGVLEGADGGELLQVAAGHEHAVAGAGDHEHARRGVRHLVERRRQLLHGGAGDGVARLGPVDGEHGEPVVTVEPHTARSAHCWIEYQIAESRSPCPVWPRRG